MKRRIIFLILLLVSRFACADGGRLRLQQPAGPFVVTLFTTPDPLTVGQSDFSVAVEKQNLGGLVQDAEVNFIITPTDGKGERLVLKATHDAATSKFLQAANFTFPHPGKWLVTVVVQEGKEVGRTSAEVEVLPSSFANNELIMSMAIVPFAIALFFLHQWRKRVYRHAS